MEARQARQVVDHEQVRPVLAARLPEAFHSREFRQIGQLSFAAEAAEDELEAVGRRPERRHALLHVDRGHLAVDIDNAMAAARLPAEEARSGGRGPGHAHGHVGLADTARAVEQAQAALAQDGAEDVEPFRQLGRQQAARRDGVRRRVRREEEGAGLVVHHRFGLSSRFTKVKYDYCKWTPDWFPISVGNGWEAFREAIDQGDGCREQPSRFG